jgi:hypothetical protein
MSVGASSDVIAGAKTGMTKGYQARAFRQKSNTALSMLISIENDQR